MHFLRFFQASWIALFVLATLPAQTLDYSIALDDGDPTATDEAFGIVLSADGLHAYAAICGQLSVPPTLNNDNIAKLDVIAGTQVALGQTGLFPEDPALTYDASGAVRHVYVTNSTSGTVTCLTPALVPVATIPLPMCSFGAFPFGLLVSPDQSRVYVSTVCGDVQVLDSNPTSGTFNTVVGTFTVANSWGRATWSVYPTMVLPTAAYDPGFSFSQAGFTVVDVLNPLIQSPHFVTGPVAGLFPATVECVAIPGGKVLLSVGSGAAPLVYECSVASGAVLRTLDLSAYTDTSLHGLATNPGQTIGVVTSLHGGDSVFFDLATFTVIGTHDHGAGSLPNDVVFTPDGSRAIVSLQGDARVDVLKNIPGYTLKLSAPATAAVGGPLTYVIDDCESGQPFANLFSLAGGGPQQIGPFTVYLSNPFELGYQSVGDVNGGHSITFTVPDLPGLPGTTVFVQALTVDRDGAIRLSNGSQTLIL